MSTNTGIQWTDATWNPVVGCEQVSPGCDNCYAKQLHDMRHRARLAGKRVLPLYETPFETVQLRPAKLLDPLSWRKPRRVFVNSMSDLFHKNVTEEFLDRAFVVMALAQQHTFQILTKRPHRMKEYINHPERIERIYAQWYGVSGKPAELPSWPLPNVWLGTSTENQATLDKRLPQLMDTVAAVRFLSMEPLLERVEIDFDDIGSRDIEGRYLDWVIVGGESGPGARHCDLDWVEEIVAECGFAGVPVFVKQLGSAPGRLSNGLTDDRVALRLRDKKGGNMAEWPAILRVRQFPGEVPA